MCNIIATPSFSHNVSRETMLVYICDHIVMCVTMHVYLFVTTNL